MRRRPDLGRRARPSAATAAVVASVVLATAGCSSGSGSSGSTSSAPPATGPAATTPVAGAGSLPAGSTPRGTAPPVTATVTGEVEVEGAFRQGLAHEPAGWVFSTNLALYATDDAYHRTGANEAAIPEQWQAQGFNHIGDVDVADGVVYAPIEQSDYAAKRQVMARYDAATLAFRDAVEVPQSHNAWVAVDDDGIAYSMSGFSDDAVTRYDVRAGWKALPPLRLDRTVERVQGGDVRGGALWLSTDDPGDRVYRVGLGDGHVDDVGTPGHVDGETEGIDATTLPSGDLHVLSVDAALLPVRVVHLQTR